MPESTSLLTACARLPTALARLTSSELLSWSRFHWSAVPIFDSHSLEIVVRILFIVVLASRLKLSLLPDSELLPKTRSLGTPIAPRIKVDNLSCSETVEAVTSLRMTPARIPLGSSRDAIA